MLGVSTAVRLSLLASLYLVAELETPANAQEICGLQTANMDSIFTYGFDNPTVGGGLGPSLGSTNPPTLGIAPTIAISSPSAGALLPGGRVQVSGTVSGSSNTGVIVNGLRASIYNGTFLIPELRIDPLQTSISATATTMDGLTSTANLSVSPSPSAPLVTITPDAPSGFSPLPVKFSLRVAPGLVVQSVSVDFDSNGTPDYTGSAAGLLPAHTYSTPGIYTATATVTLDDNQQIAALYKVIAIDFATQRSTICMVYAHLRSRLTAQDASGASYALSGTLGSRLIPLFTALGPRMPEVAANLGTLADGLIGLDSADIFAIRDLTSEVRGYPVHFSRDAKAVWRIDSM